MKKKIIVWLALLSPVILAGQTNKADSVAIIILDRMSDVIGDLESCSFKLTVANDLPGQRNTLVKHFSDYDVFFGGADKLKIDVRGEKGHRQFFYNGLELAYYSFDENNYGVVDVPPTVIDMFDSVQSQYGYEFPGADFFYPAFTDDLLESSDSLRYLGLIKVRNKEYLHLISYGKEMNIQLWITNDAYNLPGIFSITYNKKTGMPQYTGTFSDWELNPRLPDAMFDFQPPPGARQVRIASRTDR